MMLTAGETWLTAGAEPLNVGMPGRLKYAPPVQVSPTVVNPGVGYFAATFAPDEDVLVVFPTVARTAQLDIVGGRHIRVIGGAGVGSGGRVRFRGVHGSVFVQGLDLDMGGVNADAVSAHGVQPEDGNPTYPDVYLQDIRITGLTGTTETVHADAYQVQGPVGTLYVDRLTASTDYQGFFLNPDSGIAAAKLSRVNFREFNGTSGKHLYLSSTPPRAVQEYPITLDLVYSEVTQTGATLRSTRVYPGAGVIRDDAVPVGAVYGAATNSVSWPAESGITGRVIGGLPPDGDFVPLGVAGVGYINPGYLPA